MIEKHEAQSRAAAMEYECNQNDYTMFGWPDESAYQAYQPYQALRR